MGNMTIWDSVFETNPENTKKVNQRGGFTAICATSQIKVMTEQFGSCGIGWGLEDSKYQIVQLSDKRQDDILVFSANLFYYVGEKKGLIPIDSEIDIWTGARKNNDIHKKVKTDAMTKGFSFLGLSADVFMGKFDDNKYVSDLKAKFGGEEQPPKNNTPVKRVEPIKKEDPKARVTEITHNIVKSYLTDPRFSESVELKEMKLRLNDKSLLANQYLVDELIKEYGSLNG